MRHRLLLPLLLVLLASPAAAQNYTRDVQLTFDNTAGGSGFTLTDLLGGDGHPQANSAACVSNPSGGDFRYRTDGTGPTSGVGNIVTAGGALIFTNTQAMIGFRAIRTASTNAVLNCSLSDAIVVAQPPVYPVGAGGGLSGSGIPVTQGTIPWVISGEVTANAGTGWGTDATTGVTAVTVGPQVMNLSTSTYPTAVTTGQASRNAAGLDGISISRPHAHVGDFIKGLVAITDGSSTSLVAAQGSGIRFCATTIVVSNSSATNVTVDIRDGTAGSVIMTIPAAANMGGAVIPLAVPLCTTANTIMAADPSAAASTVTTTAVGFRTAQ